MVCNNESSLCFITYRRYDNPSEGDDEKGEQDVRQGRISSGWMRRLGGRVHFRDKRSFSSRFFSASLYLFVPCLHRSYDSHMVSPSPDLGRPKPPRKNKTTRVTYLNLNTVFTTETRTDYRKHLA